MKLYFDLLITIGIIITALPAVILVYSKFRRPESWEHRHPKWTVLLVILLLIGTFTLVWGSFIEPRIIVTKTHEIDLDEIKKPIKVALISDFQIGPYKKTKWMQKVVKKIIELQPDIVLLAGDHVDNSEYDEMEVTYLKPLQELVEKKIPVYAIHGNHEYGIGGGKAVKDPKYRIANVTKETKETMEKLGIPYLVNDLEKITILDESFYLFGADAWWGGKHDFSKLDERTEDIPTLMFIHNPAAVPTISKLENIDIMLSGHTHGGQIRLPLIGPVARVEDVSAKLHQGLHDIDDIKLLVTSGVGETGTRARLFNPPEIVLLTIK
ncbi:hypothetical protein HOF40_00040 [Candidatus Parcubacteria bacterium]|jgi:uncharacterized protein|nr:hypothetical protein [Candidatus Parcubacteria bacterium]MBT3948460.1 hypothetical protein [Candidatus Parcubacteria bacterium]